MGSKLVKIYTNNCRLAKEITMTMFKFEKLHVILGTKDIVQLKGFTLVWNISIDMPRTAACKQNLNEKLRSDASCINLYSGMIRMKKVKV